MHATEQSLDRTLRKFTVAYVILCILMAGVIGFGHLAAQRLWEAMRATDAGLTALRMQQADAGRIVNLLDGSDRAGLKSARDAFAARARALLDGDAATPPLRAALSGIYFNPPHRLADRTRLLIDAADKALSADPPLSAAAIGPVRRVAEGGFAAALIAADANVRAEGRTRAAAARRLEFFAFVGAVVVLIMTGIFLYRPLHLRLRDAGDALLVAEEEIAHSLSHDPATGLPNRKSLRNVLSRALAQADPDTPRHVLFHYDLIGFRGLSRMFGDEVAGAAVRRAGAVITGEARDGDFTAQVGPDEFCVVQASVATPGEIEARARHVSQAIAAPFEVGDAVLELPNVAAAAQIGPDADNADALMRNVEIALSAAKQDGSGGFRLYTPDLRQKWEARERLRADLKRAIEQDEFEPFFQPQVCARSGQLDGFEALARWRHPERGVLTPAHFLYTAVEYGLGDQLDERMMEKSLDAFAAWREGGLDIPRVSINFSSEQLGDPFMIEKIRWAVDRRDIEPASVCIEILETVLMEEEGAEVIRNVEGLSRAGFGIDLDDFGTGHASIATLQQFSVDRIKIDRSFVQDIDSRADSRKVVRAMVDLAHSLGAKVLAEGVETEAEMAQLAELGCNHIQGYAVARPMPGDEVGVWTRSYTRALAARQVASG